ncbi:MAG: hypothetical protein V4723_12345 [Pseudomonadota bacterium]
MNTKQILLATLLAGAFAPALALATEPNVAFEAGSFDNGDDKQVREHVVVRNGDATHVMSGFDHMNFSGSLLRGRVVKNAPYSGEAITERQHTLGDGNQITKSSSTLNYRDSAGRTRQEVRDDNGKVRTVTIRDSVEGSTYILNPETRTATKIGPIGDLRAMGDKARADAAVIRDKAHAERDALREKMRADLDKGKYSEEVRKGPNGEHIIVKRIERKDGEPGKQIREDVRIRLANGLDGKTMAGLDVLERMGPMMAGHFGDSKWSRNVSNKDLGSKDIDGVKAQGKMRSYEIPAGEIGNKNPIIVSTETWYSPDLQVTVYSKHSDPRTGDRTYRLASLKREEPAPALFTVPSDYKINEPIKHMHKFEIKK